MDHSSKTKGWICRWELNTIRSDLAPFPLALAKQASRRLGWSLGSPHSCPSMDPNLSPPQNHEHPEQYTNIYLLRRSSIESLKSATMSTQAYPPGGTFFDNIKRSFVDVPVNKEKDNAVSTTEFLEAAESLTTLFGTLKYTQYPFVFWKTHVWCQDVLGSVAFNAVKSDMLGNVKVQIYAPPPPRTHEVWEVHWTNHFKRLQKLRDRQLAAPADSETIQELVINELKTKKHTATEGLLWLVRYAQHSTFPITTTYPLTYS